MSYSIFFIFEFIYFIYFYVFKLWKHSKYMIIADIEIFWNFDSFPNCQVLKIFSFSKLKNFRNLIILWIFNNGNLTIFEIY